MKNYVFIISIIFLLSSCCKATIETIVLFRNTTNNKIELRFYKSGVVSSSTIQANSEFTYAERVVTFYIPADSVQIYLNDTRYQTHNNRNVVKPADSVKVLAFGEPNNLFNIENYQSDREELSSYCGGSITTYTYSF